MHETFDLGEYQCPNCLAGMCGLIQSVVLHTVCDGYLCGGRDMYGLFIGGVLQQGKCMPHTICVGLFVRGRRYV